MNLATKVSILVLLLVASLDAQSLPTEKSTVTKWLIDGESGSETGLGYKFPHLSFGTSFERSMGTHAEMQGGVSFSPDKKYVTNDGSSLVLKSRGLFWITPRFAITGSLNRSDLWTSQFSKSTWLPSIGIAIREHLEGLPGRLYLAYLFPTGCEWGASCPIQSNRMMGPEGYWEHRMMPHFRLGLHIGDYRILSQGNSLQPSSRCGSIWSGDVRLVVRYEFPRDSMANAY